GVVLPTVADVVAGLQPAPPAIQPGTIERLLVAADHGGVGRGPLPEALAGRGAVGDRDGHQAVPGVSLFVPRLPRSVAAVGQRRVRLLRCERVDTRPVRPGNLP